MSQSKRKAISLVLKLHVKSGEEAVNIERALLLEPTIFTATCNRDSDLINQLVSIVSPLQSKQNTIAGNSLLVKIESHLSILDARSKIS